MRNKITDKSLNKTYKCPECGSRHIVKAGRVECCGMRQRYYCKKCGRYTVYPKKV